MKIRLLRSIEEVASDAWNALCGDHDPFVEHEFLSLLEQSSSVGQGTGWDPLHLSIWEDETLVGALPLYLKDHSYGEYIFDWSWADASLRMGVPYYPKLVSMVPVTPVTGSRFLIKADAKRRDVVSKLLQGCEEAQRETNAHSMHLLFLNQEELEEVEGCESWMTRVSLQFHWLNNDYKSFDDYLNTYRSSARKQLRKERRIVSESRCEIRVMRGDQLSEEDWNVAYRLYYNTCVRKGSYPYLTASFFRLAAQCLKHRAVMVQALKQGRIIAMSLNLEKGKHLYGRYWGCEEHQDMLHFELCYYRLIEYAISEGHRCFQAGAQGLHKLRRGLMPTPIYSAHQIRDAGLAQAIKEFLPRERHAVLKQIRELSEHGPFKRDH